jgi:hypothetical protein
VHQLMHHRDAHSVATGSLPSKRSMLFQPAGCAS